MVQYEMKFPNDDFSKQNNLLNDGDKLSWERGSFMRYYAFSDAISILFGFIAATIILSFAYSLFGEHFNLVAYSHSRFFGFIAVYAGLLIWFQHNGHYRIRMPFWQETQKIVNAVGFALLIDVFFQFSAKQEIPRLLVLLGWVLSAAFIVISRSLIRHVMKKRGLLKVRTLLVGSGSTAQQAVSALKSAPELGYEITAQIRNLPEAFMKAGRSWRALCAMYNVEYIIIALDGDEMDSSQKMMVKLMRETIPFSVVPPPRHLPVMGMERQYFFSHDAFLLTRNSGLTQPIPRFFKRLFDILVSGCALIVLSPLMLVIAFMVKRDGGDALFGHKRIGQGGKIFPCWKFRSMIMNGDAVLKKHLAENPEAKEEWEATQKLQNDPRVTKIGKFLRSTSLDEIPQLINVLKGEMSLVGPRPIVADEVKHYNYDIAHYHRVRPGVTGLWQVSGRNDVSYAQRVQMDSWYVRNWSLWHDIAIMCKTVPAVLKRSGAY